MCAMLWQREWGQSLKGRQASFTWKQQLREQTCNHRHLYNLTAGNKTRLHPVPTKANSTTMVQHFQWKVLTFSHCSADPALSWVSQGVARDFFALESRERCFSKYWRAISFQPQVADVKEREELLQLHGRHWKCTGQALGLNVISP